MMDIIKSIEHEQLKSKIPNIKIGDTVRVHQRIKEGNRERIQVFEGIVIKKQNGGLNETFTVRRVAYGVGVEKTFLVHSPLVEKVELVRVGKVRRAKLYYLRDRIGKAAKTKENIGANLNRDDIVVKEEIPETTEVEEVATEEVVENVETAEVEEVKEEKVEEKKEEAKVEEKAEKKEDKKDE
ncbi:MAG: 50S ribosomal protein L19 [Clostridia bacterium]|nr:50S ribosomal protein L19 [Clostridia bacterium]